jgi:hypothetical protein
MVYLTIMQNVVHISQKTLHTDYKKFAVNDVYENNVCVSRALCKTGNCTVGQCVAVLDLEGMVRKSTTVLQMGNKGRPTS